MISTCFKLGSLTARDRTCRQGGTELGGHHERPLINVVEIYKSCEDCLAMVELTMMDSTIAEELGAIVELAADEC